MSHNSRKPLTGILIAFFIVFFATAFAREDARKDLSVFKPYVPVLLKKQYDTALNTIRQKKNPEYGESFLAGYLYKRKKSYGSATWWYARAAYEGRKGPKSSKTEDLTAYLNSTSGRSPLYGEAILEISKIYLRKYGVKAANQILSLMPEKRNKALESGILDLSADIIAHYNSSLAIQLYLDLLTKKEDPYYYLRIAGFLYTSRQYERSLKFYFKVLEFPKTDWTYTTATSMILRILKKSPKMNENINDYRKVKLAEGLRIKKKYPDSLAMWKTIEIKKLSKKGLYYYTQNYSRLLVNLGQYDSLKKILVANSPKLNPADREKVYADAAKRLLKKRKYYHVKALIPKDAGESVKYRLQALERISDPARVPEAASYLQNVDSTSKDAERAYFSYCLELIEKGHNTKAQNCLQELRTLTTGSENGGRSRYFLAALVEKNGETEKARSLYREVYTNSPTHYLSYKALQKKGPSNASPLPEQNAADNSTGQSSNAIYRNWVAENFSNVASIKSFFDKKKSTPGYGIDPAWKSWETKMNRMSSTLDEVEFRAALFVAMGEYKLAAKYLEQIPDKVRRYSVATFAAKSVGNDHLAYRYIRAVLSSSEELQADIFLMPAAAIESLYPVPFLASVQKSSSQYNLDEAFIYALMKQESAFHPGVTSHAGARGLMQIMPATARDLNRRMKIQNLDLYNPEHSIQLAAKFFSYIYKRHHGEFELSAISYNAGPARVSRWLKEYKGADTQLFLEQIPIRETYYYVKRTSGYYHRYKVLLENFY
ncbi:MAG: lytic transglycosylase domain-containing protein [Leptospirales bacterium]